MENLEKKLFKDKTNGWLKTNEKEKIFDYANRYINFLNEAKTERECTELFQKILNKHGFQDIEKISTLKPGDKVYYINRYKNIYAGVIGKKEMEQGLNIIGAHIDSPRLDLKPNPLYEDTEIAMFKTHYYGGIKKYQWVNIPLSMHGVIIKANGEKITINLGEKEEEPIFTIPDLLPHLGRLQGEKKLNEAIDGEDLNILVGSIPYDEKAKEQVKLNILNILNQKYNITEEDFASSEIEFTPAMKAKSLGFDQSMVAGYGQDDRVCAYTSLSALLQIENPEKTAICLLADKEEIGSVGNTGMCSHTFEYFINTLLDKTSGNYPGALTKVFNKTKVLSADVTGAFDPTYANVYEKNNESYIGYGVSINKYTGSASKGGASDANAEYVAKIRGIFERENIAYQISEMGKIGIGGGGTISYILADRGMEVIDCGIPVLSMHSPYEITSKFDIYEAYKAYKTFYQS